ncbi:T-cell surface glycoprotein CD8 alpha chain [Betta splendens]|uniref:T-cell surface glycoprotein CD8 alpha chain n=1 Tax=Betta splendens TaxID=158456 RepID=A0A6P7MJD5_BETSP|nr:T-cell surface glycoprotein CD8 alpha chain [Betta splendens]
MDQKWIQALVILMLYQRFTSGVEVVTVNQGDSHRIECRPSEIGTIIIWFRVLDNVGMEFIASYTNNGMLKSKGIQNPRLQISDDVLTLTSFTKFEDSGVYSCASIKGNELKFGKVKRLVGVTDPVAAPEPKVVSTPPCPTTTTRPCSCNTSRAKPESASLYCPLVILGPLAGSCGLLLLLLIVTTLYCNKIRTRRCPHHYRKRPQNMTPGKQMNNRHV